MRMNETRERTCVGVVSEGSVNMRICMYACVDVMCMLMRVGILMLKYVKNESGASAMVRICMHVSVYAYIIYENRVRRTCSYAHVHVYVWPCV